VEQGTEIEKIVIEKSEDGQSFSPISTTEKKEGMTIDGAYRHTWIHWDKTLYYRLKTVTVNGNFSYSRVVRLEDGSQDKTGVNLQNPFGSSLSVDFNLPHTNIQLRLLDASGRVVHSSLHQAGADNKFVKLNTSSLANGVYTLQADTGGKTLSRKVVKVSN
jgi:hypothetical protein